MLVLPDWFDRCELHKYYILQYILQTKMGIPMEYSNTNGLCRAGYLVWYVLCPHWQFGNLNGK